MTSSAVSEIAGRGPKPKDPSSRARTNKSAIATKILRVELSAQPELPGGTSKWPARTVIWWKMWDDAPQSVLFMASDWEFLLDTALIHAKFWAGEMNLAGELRLRVAKFGATLEDRDRLKMQFATTDEVVERGNTRRERMSSKQPAATRDPRLALTLVR